MKNLLMLISMAAMLQACSDIKEKQFISGCQSTGMPAPVCECMADELDGNVEHPTNSDLFNASLSCRKKLFGD